MAISCDKNQVLTIPPVNGCGDDYCVPIEQGDTTPIKIGLTAISPNLVTNGTFASGTNWTTAGFWSISGGKATWANSGSADDLTQTIPTTLLPGYYLIKFDLVNNPISTALMEIRLAGTLFSGIIFSGVANATAQTFYIYGKVDTVSNNNLVINAGYSVSLQIDNVEVYRLSEVAFDIKDCETDEVFYSQTDSSDVEYFETGTITLTNKNPTPTEGAVGYGILTLDWSEYDLADGCYCLCLKDGGLLGYEMIQNGSFTTTDFWDITNTGAKGWSIASGVAKHEVTGTAGDDILEQELATPLSGDLCYKLTFDVAAVAGVGDTTLAVIYLLDGTPVSSNYYILDTFPVSLESDIDFAADTIQFVATEAGLRDISIDNVSILLNEECLECEITTSCISLRESWNVLRMNNILITGENETAAFGFPAGYIFSGRVFGKVRNARYPDVENVIYTDLSGLKSQQYNENEEILEFQIYEVPKRAHDWIRLALRSQTVTLNVDGVDMTVEKVGGDYTPIWRKTSELAPVIVEIQEVQQVPANARNI